MDTVGRGSCRAFATLTRQLLKGSAGASPYRASRCGLRSAILLQDAQHFSYGAVKADEHGAADDAVADVQLDHVRHRKKSLGVFVVETVTGIDFKAELMGLFGSGNQTIELTFLGEASSKCSANEPVWSSMNCAPICADASTCAWIRGDEQAHLNARVFHFLRRFGQGERDDRRRRGHLRWSLPADVPGTMQTISGFVFNAKATISGEFAISRFSRVLTTSRKLRDVAVLHVTAVFAQVCGDAVTTRGFADGCRGDGIRFAFGHRDNALRAMWRRDRC